MSAFETMIKNFCSNPEPMYRDFTEYFKQNYFNNRSNWAHCYRLHAGINTNMHLERLHRTIKYAYLKGKRVKRLDKGIHAIMKLTRNKLIDRMVVIHKGKISDKLKNIRKRHKNIIHLEPNLLIRVEHGREIPSKKTNEIYYIQDNLESCDCKLICSECNICIHRYYCSCPDSAVRFNMCKHIHLVATCLTRKEEITINMTTETKDLGISIGYLYLIMGGMNKMKFMLLLSGPLFIFYHYL